MKLSGNYEFTTGGGAGEFYNLVTGAPVTYFKISDASTINSNADTLFALIKDAFDEDFFVAAGSSCTTLENVYNIACNHAYSVEGYY